MSNAPAISVIVPVRDDGDGIERLLDRLERQTVGADRFEVVIGDDGSSPPLDTNGHPHVRVVRGGPLTSYDARNRAVGAASGDILAFCDSDCLPDDEWLARGVRSLEGADLVAGHVRFQPPDRPSVWTYLTADMFLDQRRNVRLGRAVTANLFVRREAFERIGGFDPTLPSGGDYDFAERAGRAGLELRYSPGAVVGHPTLDRALAFLTKVWRTNRWSGARRARDGMRPDLGGALGLVPVLGIARARRAALSPAADLNVARVRDAGLSPGPGRRVAAVLLLYAVVAYVAGAGRLRGWTHGLAMRRRARELEAQPEGGSGGGGAWAGSM